MLHEFCESYCVGGLLAGGAVPDCLDVDDRKRDASTVGPWVGDPPYMLSIGEESGTMGRDTYWSILGEFG